MTYRIWEARNAGEDTTYLVAMFSVRETSLREEIARGERLIRLLRLVAETEDRNRARRMADCEI
ncbi:hypothetical protein [Desulfofundulus thermocisternus]|uniref:hypothetical protein n=1 Tax=Desulfofundulus thermocisternus TaxID=42471 RepID=UPI00217EC3A6|nr:hypothetical protein [Desulfofundulus thermocisternus]MCS5697167.1 hypothetical protein [Desulfofundulus thermocisternus]